MLACVLALGALCVLSIGYFNLPSWLLIAIIFGAGLGGGCQGGINTLSGLIYPATIRSTGAGWALGVERIGSIAGPLLGGLLLALGFRARSIFIAAFIPALGVTVLMTTLGHLRHRQHHSMIRNSNESERVENR